MRILLSVGDPYPTAVWECISGELQHDDSHEIYQLGDVYVDLDLVVVVRFSGHFGHVICRGKGDTKVCTEVLAQLIREKLVEYQYTFDFDDRPVESVPLVEVRIPENISDPDLVIKWSKAIACGVKQFIAHQNQKVCN